MKIVFLLSVLLAVCGVLVDGNDLYTSTAAIHHLLDLRDDLELIVQREIVHDHANAEHLREIKNLLTIVPRKQGGPFTPASAFLVINRLNKVNNLLDSLRKQAVNDSHVQTWTKPFVTEFPTYEDVDGASAGLIRLQELYLTEPIEFFEQDDGKTLRAATVGDLGEIAYRAIDDNRILSGLRWLLLIDDRRIELQTDADRCFFMDYLTYAYYKLGMLAKAYEESVQMTHDPCLQEYYNRPNFESRYRAVEEQLQIILAERPEELHIEPPSADNVDKYYYNKLCRGEEIDPAELEAAFSDMNVHQHPERLICKYSASHWGAFPIEILWSGDNSDVILFHEFVTDNEREAIKMMATPHLARSTARASDGVFRPQNYRISQGAFIADYMVGEDDAVILQRVNDRIGTALQLNMEHAELLQIANYGIGGYYDIHYDVGDPPSKTNDRIATFMIYLNEPDEGGYTVYPRKGAFSKPLARSAVFWYNINPDWEVEPTSLHAGCPVMKGEKWVANKWIRTVPQEAWWPHHHLIPADDGPR